MPSLSVPRLKPWRSSCCWEEFMSSRVCANRFSCMLGFVLTRAGSAQAAVDAYEKGLKADPKSKACQQGKEEAKSILERGAGKKTVVAGKDDVEAQELLTLPAPDGVLGKGFEVVKLLVQGQLLTFLLATAVPLECTITPETCKLLGLKIDRTVDLEGVSFESGKAIGTLKECMVHTFVQATVAEKALGAKLHGMLGIPFLKRYDLDLDRVRCEQRFKEAGKAAKAFSSGAMSEERVGTVHMTSINLPGGLFGVPLQVKLKDKATYVLGVVDSSSMFSVLNWKAAEDLGLPPDAEDPIYDTYTKVAGATVDGVAEMPLVNAKVQICRSSEEIGCRLGAISKEEFDTTGKGGGWTLGLSEVADIRACAEFGRVNAAVGDAIQFEMLSDSAVGQFIGGAMLIGQDILAQSPKLTLSAQDRQMWLDPPSRIVDESPF
mmetsp:Transcript_55483/g.162984  ORF Transcript_55483/g.162984 Transcript_55483/m.162984 type:complete len:434 (-) Transcript_55483:174-1475(-)